MTFHMEKKSENKWFFQQGTGNIMLSYIQFCPKWMYLKKRTHWNIMRYTDLHFLLNRTQEIAVISLISKFMV